MLSNDDKEKYELVKKLLISEPSILLYLHTEHPAVVIPDYLKEKPYVTLQFGFDLPIPINDMDVTLLGISGTLSFKGQKHWCLVPWEACYAVAMENQTVVAQWAMPKNFKSAGNLNKSQKSTGASSTASTNNVVDLNAYRFKRACEGTLPSQRANSGSFPKSSGRQRRWYVKPVKQETSISHDDDSNKNDDDPKNAG